MAAGVTEYSDCACALVGQAFGSVVAALVTALDGLDAANAKRSTKNPACRNWVPIFLMGHSPVLCFEWIGRRYDCAAKGPKVSRGVGKRNMGERVRLVTQHDNAPYNLGEAGSRKRSLAERVRFFSLFR
jgi:hypothetical protein